VTATAPWRLGRIYEKAVPLGRRPQSHLWVPFCPKPRGAPFRFLVFPYEDLRRAREPVQRAFRCRPQSIRGALVRDHSIGRLFMPRRSVGFFTKAETVGLIDASLQGTGVTFEAALRDRVHEVTRGHVFEVQALCEALFDRQIRGRVLMENWETALHHTLIALADAEFKGMLGRASDQELAVLRAIARSGETLGPSGVKRLCPGVGGVREVLRRMVSKGLVERSARGSYRLTDWLFAEYVRRCNMAP
jgi:hypothetical protein